MRTKLHFARFEFKYLLPKKLRDELESELQYFVEFDPYVASKPHRKYFVRSLYFDDPVYSAFYDKHDGLHTRAKFRVRTYTDNPVDNTLRFLELKGRSNNLVFKHRVQLDGQIDYVPVEGKELAAQVLRETEECPVRSQFEFELYRKRIRPVALVDYFRRPYISKYDPEFRLTFDDHLQCTHTNALHNSPADSPRNMLTGYTVMEVKFRYHIPSWFHRIIQSFELRRVSISKICAAIETLGLTENLS